MKITNYPPKQIEELVDVSFIENTNIREAFLYGKIFNIEETVSRQRENLTLGIVGINVLAVLNNYLVLIEVSNTNFKVLWNFGGIN